jgi:polyphosphate:AMP phosphotransferase
MFETAELKHTISKLQYNEEVPHLRTELLQIQQELRQQKIPVIIVFGGVDAAGKGETINRLNEWLDPRWVITRAYGPVSDEEDERPEFWRYWRDLPPKGLIGLFLSAWYSRPILQRVYGHSDEAHFDKDLERIVNFEKALADDGALVLKFWMHLGRTAQKKRFKALEKDPLTSWRVTKGDWDNLEHYDDFVAAAERTIARTSTGRSSWQIVEGYDSRYYELTVAKALRDAAQKHLTETRLRRKLVEELSREAEPAPKTPEEGDDTTAPAPHAPPGGVTILSALDMDKVLTKKAYRTELATFQAKLNKLQRKAVQSGISGVLLFEGWDAGGKGGAIRRITQALDARNYRVISIAAPTDEEQQFHYLWRFWRHLSRAGRVTIFDRSWYGRVLVERVEGFASEVEWRRAFAEINDFEEQLTNHGIFVCKFWLHITPEEQLQRFKDREKIAYKRWKLTDEDWRNRAKWDYYEEAANDMIERTSTAHSPWILVEGNDKRQARVRVLREVCATLDKALH